MAPGGPAPETAPLLPKKRSPVARDSHGPGTRPKPRRNPPIIMGVIALFLLSAALLIANGKWRYPSTPRVNLAAVQQCTLDNLPADLPFLDIAGTTNPGIKSLPVLDIKRAVNTGTLAAVRAARPCLVPGMTEPDVANIIQAAEVVMGFEPVHLSVLFEENALLQSQQHGSITKTLTYDTMVVVDIGARLMGYESDLSRSFLIDPPRFWKHIFNDRYAEKQTAWKVAHDAQTAFAERLRPGNEDLAAHTDADSTSYGSTLTLTQSEESGVKSHEDSGLDTYVVKAGVSLDGKFGVRLKDVYVVREHSEPELLTGQRAKGLRDP